MKNIPNKFLYIALIAHGMYNTSCSNPDTTPEIPHKDLFNNILLGCDPTTAREIDFFQTNHLVNIATLESPDGLKFIVKQNNNISMTTALLCVAREKLGSLIAELIGLHVNSVEILPINYPFPSKRFLELPATLHTFCPGTRIKLLTPDSPFYKINIHQKNSSKIPEKTRGLTYEVIQNMAKHPDLPVIVALDTFISNRGRHSNNFFYCSISNHFYVIDMESSFATHLGGHACRCIEAILDKHSGVKLSPQEIKALKLYNETLQKLLSQHSVEKMHELLKAYIFQANPFWQQNTSPDKYISTEEPLHTLPQYNTDQQSADPISTTDYQGLPQTSDNDEFLIKSIEDALENDIDTNIDTQLDMYLTMMTQNYQSCQTLTKLLDKLLN